MVSKNPFIDDNGTPFLSPLMKRIVSVPPVLSPTNSPTKPSTRSNTSSPSKTGTKDVILPGGSPIKLSPVRTPKGRAGLRSPAKRSMDDVNNSAIKRAYRTKISAVLAEEDDDSDDDYGNQQDLELVDSIINGSDEEDLDDEFDPRKEQEADDSNEEEDDEDSPTNLSTSWTSPSRSSPSKRSPSKRMGSKLTSSKLSPSKGSKSDKANIEKSSRPGVKIPEQQPEKNKSNRVYAGKHIFSIFNDNDLNEHYDHDDYDKLPEPITKKRKTGRLTDERPDNDLFSMALQEPKETIPVISGLPSLENDQIERSRYTKFQALPVPRLLDNEEIPKNYIQQYLPNIKWDNSKTNEIADDRAYFYEGPQGYFEQWSNRERHSVHLLSQLGMSLDNNEFSESLELLTHIKRHEKNRLLELYKPLFHQWSFELTQGFNICCYGVGSKINLITEFVTDYLVLWMEDFYNLDDSQIPKILVINGYNPSFKMSHILDDLLTILIPEEVRLHAKIPKVIADAWPIILRILGKLRAKNTRYLVPKLILVVHCIDAEPVRDMSTQNKLADLANLPEVRLICSTENIAASLLWDPYKVEHFRFIYHYMTTYEPYIVETSHKDVITLGRTKRNVSSRGAKFVLSALNENSRKIFKILLNLQLDNITTTNPKSSFNSARGSVKNGVEFKAFHQTCIENFITGNEINFRSMLGEFIEHNICKLVKNEAGREILFIPFSTEEMSKLLRESYRD